jgi:hypothetical protein
MKWPFEFMSDQFFRIATKTIPTLLVAIFLFVLCESKAAATGSPLQEADMISATECASLGEGFARLNPDVFCYKGIILSDIVEPLTEAVRAYSSSDSTPVLIIDSVGGDAKAAMQLGIALHEKDFRVVVYGECTSSCANYVFSSAQSVGVLPYSVVLMHGSLPRSRREYVDMALSRDGITERNLQDNIQLFLDRWDEYPKYFHDELAMENSFFLKVELDEQYLHRYKSIWENSVINNPPQCQRKKGLFLVVGPDYFSRYRPSTVDYFWFPDREDTKKIVDNLDGAAERFDFYFDDEKYPRWLAGRGVVDEEYCR